MIQVAKTKCFKTVTVCNYTYNTKNHDIK